MADRLGLPKVSDCHRQLLAELQADEPGQETRLHGATAASSTTIRGDPIGDGSLAGLAEVMADACGRDSGRDFVVLADSGTLPTIKVCRRYGVAYVYYEVARGGQPGRAAFPSASHRLPQKR